MKESDKLTGLHAALEELPIFPLHQVVLFPRALLPLHIFEPRYRALLRDCVNSHGAMAIALLVDDGQLDAYGNPKIATIAGAGVIIENQEMPDGRSNILLHGRARVELAELPFVPPYRRARARIIHDLPGTVSADDRTALLTAANAFAGEVHKRDTNFSFSIPPSLEPGAIADLCAHHLVVSAKARQAILEERDMVARVRKVISELAVQHSELLREGGSELN